MKKTRIHFIVPAAGSGDRFGAKKQFYPLSQKSVLFYTLLGIYRASHEILALASIIVAIQPDDRTTAQTIINQVEETLPDLKNKIYPVIGGKTRAESVKNALTFICKKSDPKEIIAIHDAARPFITSKMLRELLEKLEAPDCHAAIPVIPITDTIKQVDEYGNIKNTLDRSILRAAQTPQLFKLPALKEAYSSQDLEGITDDSSIIEKLGLKALIVQGDSQNIKITEKFDLEIAKLILKSR